MKLKKLNARGFSHDLVLMLFIVVFAIAGVGYLVASHADTTTSAYTSTNQFASFVYVPPVSSNGKSVSVLTHANSTNLEIQFNKDVSYQPSNTAMYELTLPANTVASSLTMNVSYSDNGYNTAFVAAGSPSSMVWKVNTASTKTNRSVTISLSSKPTTIYFGFSATGASGGFTGSSVNRYFTVNSYTLTGTTTTTAPAPTPPPPTSSGTVLFNGALVSSWADNQSCVPTRVQNVADPDGQSDSVLQFTTLDTDVAPCTPTDNPRSQLVSPAIYTPGDTYWESYEFWIPEGSPLTTASSWVALDTPSYGEPFNGSSGVILSIDNIANDSPIANGTYLGWESDGNYVKPWAYLYTETVPTGVWTRITWHYTIAENTPTSLYVNDQLVETANMSAVDASNSTGPETARLMLYYAEGEFPQATIFYKDYKIATTQAAAED